MDADKLADFGTISKTLKKTTKLQNFEKKKKTFKKRNTKL